MLPALLYQSAPLCSKPNWQRRIFTGRGDEAVVAGLYKKLFERCLATQRSLEHTCHEWTPAKAKQFGETLRELRHLAKLHLYGKGLGKVLAFLVEGLGADGKPMEQLVEIQMCHCGISDEHVPSLLELMRRCSNLTYLSLGGNSIGDAGMAALEQERENITRFLHIDFITQPFFKWLK